MKTAGELLKANRFSIRTTTVVITGHFTAGVNLQKTSSAKCEGEDETVEILLCFCPGVAEN